MLESIDINDIKIRETPKDYFEGRICCICKSDKTYIKPNGKPHWRSCKCGMENCTGYICEKCRMNIENNRPDSYSNLRKAGRLCRNKGILKDSNMGKGFIIEQVIAKFLGLENCNLKLDNFKAKFDIYPHPEYGRIQTMGRSPYYGDWFFGGRDFSGRISNGDTLFIVCMDKNWKVIIQVYRFPTKDIIHRTGITIYNNPSRRVWYEDYKIDEKPFNDIYHSMNTDNCPVIKD